MLAIVIHLILWVNSIFSLLTTSVNCRGELHTLLWVRFKAQKRGFALDLTPKFPKSAASDLSRDKFPASLVLSRCKVKKGSSFFEKLTMPLTPPAGLFLHFLSFYSRCTFCVGGRHRKPQLVGLSAMFGQTFTLPTQFPRTDWTMFNTRLQECHDKNQDAAC